MYTVICSVCEKTFERLYEKRERDICDGCALKELCGNFAPEEGDFNSARIISGEMTEQEERWLQEDLESVDHSREEAFWRRLVDDHDDSRWDYLEERDDDE